MFFKKSAEPVENKINEGDKAPDFSLPTSGNGKLSLSDLKGKKVVLYFYPKDDTPGCTKEAQEFRDVLGEFTDAGAVVLGVSKDSCNSHDKFIDKYSLNFTLISDDKGELCDAYGVWIEKSMYGKKYMGIDRSTFLIDTEGTVRKTWRKVSVTGHVEEVLKAVKGL